MIQIVSQVWTVERTTTWTGMGFSHRFRVRCDTQAGEVVAVTGSCKQLGGWNKLRIVPMTRESTDG